MSIVDLNSIYAGFQSTTNRRNVRGFEGLNVFLRHGLWLWVRVGKGDRAGCEHIVWPSAQLFGSGSIAIDPGGNGASFAACMGELNHNLLPLRMGKFNNLCERLDLRILPETSVFGSNSTVGSNTCSFYRSKAGSSLNDSTKVGQMPWSKVAILGTVLAQG